MLHLEQVLLPSYKQLRLRLLLAAAEEAGARGGGVDDVPGSSAIGHALQLQRSYVACTEVEAVVACRGHNPQVSTMTQAQAGRHNTARRQ